MNSFSTSQDTATTTNGKLPGLIAVALAGLLSGCCCAKAGKSSAPGATSAVAAAPTAKGWQSLFDGKTLKGWRVSDFAGHGEVRADDGRIFLEMGVMTGITWTNAVIPIDYEIELEAMRVAGSDFFCGLTFPVGDQPCSFIVGGWGGGVVGLSSIDGDDASNNETVKYLNFERGRWYGVRLRVTQKAIEAWIDEDKVVDLPTADRKLSIRPEVEESRPLGIASWSTTAALRKIRVRPL